MREVARKQNILLQWFAWHFFDIPRNILMAWRDFLRFYLNYFSIPQLLKTLFSPWRRYRWSYGRGFDIGRYLEAFFSNLISRTLGAILRSFLILIGLLVEVFAILGGILIFLLWIVLPVIIISGFMFGIKVIL